MAIVTGSPLIGRYWAWLNKDVKNCHWHFLPSLSDLLFCVDFILIWGPGMIEKCSDLQFKVTEEKERLFPVVLATISGVFLSGKSVRPGRMSGLGKIKWIPFGDGVIS